MTSRSTRLVARFGSATGITLAALMVVGGTAGASTGVVPRSTVQSQSAKILAAQTGEKPPKVTCKTGLEAKVGASIHCTVVPYGSKLVYPATVTMKSIHGKTANFHIQVGQAVGQANMTKFCADNAKIDAALATATTPDEFLDALQAQNKAMLDFQTTAPSPIVADAGTLVQASRQALATGDPTIFTTQKVEQAGVAVDTFCGQKVSG